MNKKEITTEVWNVKSSLEETKLVNPLEDDNWEYVVLKEEGHLPRYIPRYNCEITFNKNKVTIKKRYRKFFLI